MKKKLKFEEYAQERARLIIKHVISEGYMPFAILAFNETGKIITDCIMGNDVLPFDEAEQLIDDFRQMETTGQEKIKL